MVLLTNEFINVSIICIWYDSRTGTAMRGRFSTKNLCIHPSHVERQSLKHVKNVAVG